VADRHQKGWSFLPPLVPNIWQLQSRGDVEALIDALRHPDAGTRRGAAAALRALGAWQAVPALQAALSVESDWQVHAAVTAAIQYLDHDIHIEALIKNRDVRGLAKMLNSSRIEDIVTACHALGTLGDRQATESLVMVFRNTMLPNRVRLAAAEALLKLESAPAVVTLLGALRRDDWQVRRNAAAVLGQLQATWATEPLIKALDDPHLVVRRTALATLRRFGTPEALQAVKAFEDVQRKPAPEPIPESADPAASNLMAMRLTLPPIPPPQGELPAQPAPKLPEAPVKLPKTGKLPPLPLPQDAEAPAKPMIRQLEESGGLAKTGRLPGLPPLLTDETPPAQDDQTPPTE
jgi:HEAT repeat protein